MRLLLDTHVLLWALMDSGQLRPAARSLLADGANDVYVSAASAWELGIKSALGKLKIPADLEAVLQASFLRPLAINIAHALEAAALPRHHADPFDRLLIAQARLEGLTLMTRDGRFSAYGVSTLEA